MKCCQNERFKFLQEYILPEPPIELPSLHQNDDMANRFFRKNINSINASFADTSKKSKL